MCTGLDCEVGIGGTALTFQLGNPIEGVFQLKIVTGNLQVHNFGDQDQYLVI